MFLHKIEIMKNVFIISGPAGSGKDSIIDKLATSLPTERIVTTTTRAPRAGEEHGKQYYFSSRADFERGIAEGRFAEYSVNENDAYYGVEKDELERVSRSGRIGIWRIDWKGVISAKEMFPGIIAIMINVPYEVLEARLRSRDTDKEEGYFKERMAYTKEWLKHTDIYDYVVENEQGKLDEAVEKVADIIRQHADF